MVCMCKLQLGVDVPMPKNAYDGDNVILVSLFVLNVNACELVVPIKLLLLALLPDNDQ